MIILLWYEDSTTIDQSTQPEHIFFWTWAVFFVGEVPAVVDAIALWALGDAPVVGALEKAVFAVAEGAVALVLVRLVWNVAKETINHFLVSKALEN